MNQFRLILLLGLGAASPVFAQPLVTGNTISWPDDGWYQVQDASYNEVCGGGLQCEVPDGSYTVINHSNDMRWDGIVVPANVAAVVSGGAQPSAVTVNGTTISWPDDGWYQVQSATTFQSVCEGGSSCQVGAGTYTVINHSTGVRFENIVVGLSAVADSGNTESASDSSGDSRFSSFSIDGNTINFLRAGWYQVQTGNIQAPTSVCESGSSCVVPDGSYQIVNHATGEVWQRVRVGTESVFWTQTGILQATVSWVSIIYNQEIPAGFNVYLNGNLFGNTTSNVVDVRGFDRGTNIRVAVYEILADGDESLVGEIDVLSDGPSMAAIPFGRPVEDRETFGFEFWDELPDDQLADFPSDCLFAIPFGEFCFSPATRFLIGYNRFDNLNTSSRIEWEFALPGENNTNHIEGLVNYFGRGGRRGASKRLALVADVTRSFGQSSYEISVFQGPGNFLGTFPILEEIRFSSDIGLERQINLDGSDVRVTIGPVRVPESFTPGVSSDPRRLHIAADYYEPRGIGSLESLSGWVRAGAFLAVIDADTGQGLSQTYYPGLTQQEVPEPQQE